MKQQKTGLPFAATEAVDGENGPDPVSRRNRLFLAGTIGTAVTALCCFTPVLLVLFGLLGLGGIVGYLDYVLFPMLGVFVLLLVVGAVRLQSRDTAEGVARTPGHTRRASREK